MFPCLASHSSIDAPAVSSTPVWPVPAPDPTAWPTLWARCWSRIRTWRIPPRWSSRDWWDEARAQGALAACEALRAFDPSRLVPLDAFLYRRVVESVWTLYRQEWSFSRRHPSDISPFDRPSPQPDHPDPELLARLTLALEQLDEPGRHLIRQIFWDDRSEDQLALELGISRQAVNKRKQKFLHQLRSRLGDG